MESSGNERMDMASPCSASRDSALHSAETTPKRLAGEYPPAPHTRMLLAGMLVAEGREKEAAEHLRLLLAANPDEALAWRAREMLADLMLE
jgi:predicted Zn-dependent protease